MLERATYGEGEQPGKKAVRRSLISETTRNIDSIARQVEEGLVVDKELITKLINRMLAFLNAFVKIPQEGKDDIAEAGSTED
jgi:hypothetical protein